MCKAIARILKNNFLGLLLIAELVSVKSLVFAEDLAEAPTLDGVMYSAAEPETSVAVMNGVALMAGSPIGTYKLKEIRQSSVILTDAAGNEKVIGLSTAKPSRTNRPAAAPVPKELKKDKVEGVAEGLNAVQEFLNPAKIMEKMKSSQVIMDLRNLRVQVAMYNAEHGDLPRLEELVEKGEVNPAFKGGVKGGYRFRIVEGKKGPMLYADPVDEASTLDHYMVDDWGNVRKEIGKPASYDSPLYDS